jgi:alpha-methylacyl-CoA racemase
VGNHRSTGSAHSEISGAPWYDSYETKDGEFVAIERKFYAELLRRLALEGVALPDQNARAGCPALRERFAGAFRARTRDEWSRIFEGSDACFAPVLRFREAVQHAHAVARRAHIELGKITLPAPASRFSRTPGAVRGTPPERGRAALADWGFSDEEVERLAALGLGFAA